MIGWLAAVALAGSAAGDPFLGAYAEMKDHLKALIRFDTSNPPGNELVAARYLERALADDGIESRIYVSTGSRASLIARLKGDGSRRPFLLVCHTDVVPAEAARWSVPPFDAVEKEGYVYGRGAADIKGLCAAELMVLKLLKRSGVRLSRDVVFFAQADEEVGGSERHLTWLLREHGSELDAEFAINEGGHTLWRDGRISSVHLQAAEKQYLDVTLVARGSSGHASIPRRDNPVFALGRALSRLAAWEPPLERHPIAVRFLEATAPPGSERARLTAKLSGRGWERAARAIERLDAEAGALFHDTVSATIVEGGYKANVVPSEARAVVNCRLMPGRDPKRFVRDLGRVIAEPSIELKYDADPLPPVPSMPLDTPLFAAIEEALGEQSPGARIAPFMSAWSTDAQSLRARGTIVYGLDPPMTPEDADRAHGVDERIGIDSVNAYLRLLHAVTLKIAGAPKDAPGPEGPGAANP
ncbi:MAG: M20/M25/M40 family metallo-hydrolase [Elusimicrobia bacterium]|nr:M20/M25/M40 family metallo-hydrolase [Elusimicrobiota bacterium]